MQVRITRQTNIEYKTPFFKYPFRFFKETLYLDVFTETGGHIISADGEYHGNYFMFDFETLEPGGTETFVFDVEAFDGSETETYTVNVHATKAPVWGMTKTKLRECYVKYEKKSNRNVG